MRDTPHLGATEFGAYVLLLGHYYSQGGLPDDERLLRRIARLPAGAVWNRVAPVLRALFQQPGWRHKRVEADIAKAGKFSAKMSAVSKRRWGRSPGDKSATARGGWIGRKSLKSHDPKMRGAMLSEVRDKSLTSFGRGIVGKEDDRGSKNGSGSHPQTRRQREAEQAWQQALLRELGRDAFADALDVLAAHPELVDEATAAERAAKGGGLQAALSGLRRHMPGGG
jgi:uncharacterized protein YdaU (DUF1376 family)